MRGTAPQVWLQGRDEAGALIVDHEGQDALADSLDAVRGSVWEGLHTRF